MAGNREWIPAAPRISTPKTKALPFGPTGLCQHMGMDGQLIGGIAASGEKYEIDEQIRQAAIDTQFKKWLWQASGAQSSRFVT